MKQRADSSRFRWSFAALAIPVAWIAAPCMQSQAFAAAIDTSRSSWVFEATLVPPSAQQCSIANGLTGTLSAAAPAPGQSGTLAIQSGAWAIAAQSLICNIPLPGAQAVATTFAQITLTIPPGGWQIPVAASPNVGQFAATNLPVQISGVVIYDATGTLACPRLQVQQLPCQLLRSINNEQRLAVVELGEIRAAAPPQTGSEIAFRLRTSVEFWPLMPGQGRLDIAAIIVAPLQAAPTCTPDFDQSGAVGVPDIFAFLAAWFIADPRADISNDGTVNVPDIFQFLALWFSGC